MPSQALIPLAVLLLGGYLVWRTKWAAHRRRKQDPMKQVAAERLEVQKRAESIVSSMEVRLYDYERDVQGRVDTTLKMLDQLILQAQDEIERLEQVLMATEFQPHEYEPTEKLTDDLLDRAQRLAQLGLTREEIARVLNCSLNALPTDDTDKNAA